jgi:hypothetical protein
MYRILWFLPVALFLGLLKNSFFLQTEELFIAFISIFFFSMIFTFLHKLINSFFFLRYDLIYTIFYFLLSLTILCFFIVNVFFAWLAVSLALFDSYLLVMMTRYYMALTLYKDKLFKVLTFLFFASFAVQGLGMDVLSNSKGNWRNIFLPI